MLSNEQGEVVCFLDEFNFRTLSKFYKGLTDLLKRQGNDLSDKKTNFVLSMVWNGKKIGRISRLYSNTTFSQTPQFLSEIYI